MSLFNGLLIFLLIIFTYSLLVIILKKKGILEKYKISLYGPGLLIRTKKGRFFLKKIASKKRFWKTFGNLGIIFCLITMVFMTSILIWQAWTISGFTPEEKEVLPGPEFAIVLPGINPILPLEYLLYIILALIVAIIVHEFSHGIMTYAIKIKVKSLGILYLIVPIGAFCEPDEEQLKKTKSSNRMRVYAAGPTSNFVVVLISLILFSTIFMSSVNIVDGVSVFYVGENTPADEIGLSPGCIITNINNTEINDIIDFYYTLENTTANQSVILTYYKQSKYSTKNVTLLDKYLYTKNISHKGKGYLGVGPNIYAEGYLNTLKNPFNQFPDSFILFYALPIWSYFQGFNPIVSPFTDSYIISDPLSFIPNTMFWIIVNSLYWIFWINLAVGLFNVLPMVPLDGGFLFNDAVSKTIKKIKTGISDEKRTKAVKNISLLISLIILFLILFPWLIKYL